MSLSSPPSFNLRSRTSRRAAAVDANSASPDSKSSTPKSSSTAYSSKIVPTDHEREHLRQLATETLATLDSGGYVSPAGVQVNIRKTVDISLKGTLFYSPTALDNWANRERAHGPSTNIRIREFTPLQAARELYSDAKTLAEESGWTTPVAIGVLNLASSATKPGGGFRDGAMAWEESIVRVSSLFASLTTPTGSYFYKKDIRAQEGPIYSHSMVYSPCVVAFKTDDRKFLEEPYEFSVITSCAVNSGEVRKLNLHQEEEKVERAISRIMKERMARILGLFHDRGEKWLVLGAYGTGPYRNSVELVAQLWAELLIHEDAAFRGVFSRIEFALIGSEAYERFKAAFQ